MGQNTTVLETLGVMSAKAVRLDVLSDQEWTELEHLKGVGMLEIKRRMLAEGVSPELATSYAAALTLYIAEARVAYRKYGDTLDRLRHKLTAAIGEVEQARKDQGRPA